MKIKILFCFWSQSFLNYFYLQLKNGLPPVLKAGSSGILLSFLVTVFILIRKRDRDRRVLTKMTTNEAPYHNYHF